jgi:hypothetical protein
MSSREAETHAHNTDRRVSIDRRAKKVDNVDLQRISPIEAADIADEMLSEFNIYVKEESDLLSRKSMFRRADSISVDNTRKGVSSRASTTRLPQTTSPIIPCRDIDRIAYLKLRGTCDLQFASLHEMLSGDALLDRHDAANKLDKLYQNMWLGLQLAHQTGAHQTNPTRAAPKQVSPEGHNLLPIKKNPVTEEHNRLLTKESPVTEGRNLPPIKEAPTAVRTVAFAENCSPTLGASNSQDVRKSAADAEAKESVAGGEMKGSVSYAEVKEVWNLMDQDEQRTISRVQCIDFMSSANNDKPKLTQGAIEAKFIANDLSDGGRLDFKEFHRIYCEMQEDDGEVEGFGAFEAIQTIIHVRAAAMKWKAKAAESTRKRQAEEAAEAAQRKTALAHVSYLWTKLCGCPILHPDSTFAFRCNLITTILVAFSAFQVPFRIGFGYTDDDGTVAATAFDYCVEVWFISDICVNFHLVSGTFSPAVYQLLIINPPRGTSMAIQARLFCCLRKFE